MKTKHVVKAVSYWLYSGVVLWLNKIFYESCYVVCLHLLHEVFTPKKIFRLICSCSLDVLCTQFLPYIVPSAINYWDAGSYLKYLCCLSYILTPVATLTYHCFINVCYEHVHVLHVKLLSAEWCWMFCSMCDALFCSIHFTERDPHVTCDVVNVAYNFWHYL